MAESDSRNNSVLKIFAVYGKGALIGLLVYLGVCILLFAIAFMIAFGNSSPWSGGVHQAIGAFFIVANPLWGIPLSLIGGALLVRHE